MRVSCAASVAAVTLSVAAMGLVARQSDEIRNTADGDRESVAQALTYLERGGVAWMREYGCASCHHVPFLIWTHVEASRRGYAVDPAAIESWTNWALVDTLARRNGDEGDALETLAQLLLGHDPASPWHARPAKRHQTVDPFETLRERLLAKQRPDGSFPSEGQRPFPADISTGWALVAAASRNDAPPALVERGATSGGLGPDRLAQARRIDEQLVAGTARARGWLTSAPTDGSTESLVVRLLVAAKTSSDSERREPLNALRAALLERQRGDGGWSYRPDILASDAFATGQALFALMAIGEHPDSLPVRSARRFLINQQRGDGGWTVKTTSMHGDPATRGPEHRLRTDDVYGYWGSAWATLGLLRSEAQPPAP